MNRTLVLVLLPEGIDYSNLPMPNGSVYAASDVSLEALHRRDVGLVEAVARKLTRGVVENLDAGRVAR